MHSKSHFASLAEKEEERFFLAYLVFTWARIWEKKKLSRFWRKDLRLID